VQPLALKILLVEDDESHALLSQLLLQRLGFIVQVCTNGFEAEQVFQAAPESFYIVASDYSMDRMDGLELARRVLAINPGVRFLLLTGYDHPDMLREAKKIGVRQVSLKPISVEEFDDIIKSMDL
jgi:CheY-like chemotaxis protein